MCALARVSRAGFYRFPPAPPEPDRDMALRDALQRIALEFPSYGCLWACGRRLFPNPIVEEFAVTRQGSTRWEVHLVFRLLRPDDNVPFCPD